VTFRILLLSVAWLVPSAQAQLAEQAKSVVAQIEGRISVAGLERPVEVLRDRWGVPHIYAASAADLFFAQGFVTAQDRLYQMEIWRRAGAGELAEVLGPAFLGRDRFARLVRYRGDMNAEWQSYAPDARAIAEAFARGVNALVRHSGARLPVEFQLLGFRPGEWKAEHVLLRISGLLMVRNASAELTRAEMVEKLGLEAAMKYLPTDPIRRPELDRELSLEGLSPQLLAGYRAAIAVPTLHGGEGSNNWVVDGARSATGKPLLANDPHRPILLPSLRYVVHLVGPGWNVIGAGEPAVPGVATGHNERVGFGITIDGYDQADLYVEKTDPQNPDRYLYKGQWEGMRVEREKINVKGRAAPIEVELKFTRHGPVIYEDRKGNRAVALRWAGSEPGTAGYLGSLSLDRARNWKEFQAALEGCKVPALNYVYADVEGNIGWVAAGLAPVRKNWSGLLPVPGHTGRYEWERFLPVAELPQLYNPARHYVATANHNILPKGYPHAVGFEFAAPFRFQRIDEVLRTGKKFTVEDFERLQHDETSLPARELVGMLEERDSPAVRLLKKWDCVLSKDSAAAAFFEVWLRQLPVSYVQSQIPAEARQMVSRNLTVASLLEVLRAAPAATRHRILEDSLEAAVRAARTLLGEDMAAWRWGRVHTLRLRHPLSNSEERSRVFDLGPVERGGDGNTPNATGGSGLQQGSGASYRHVLDLADWDRSVFTSVPGESGQPGSPHYADLLPLWAQGQYAPLAFTRKAVEKATRHRLLLEPAR
jgi:penicillin amidase